MTRILAISDEVDDALYGDKLYALRPDLIVACGDLPFEYLENLVSRTDVPLLFMTYLNPILAFGIERFCRAASDAGIDGLIVPDLPPTESTELRRAAEACQIDLVFFVAPTSTEAGIAAACGAATGFIYCIAVTGVTGARAQLDPALLPLIQTVRRHTSLPIVVGFGISRPEHLAALQGRADGVIVASALLDAIAESPDDPTSRVREFLTGIRPPL